MQYRLAYAQATRRQAYVESRWAAQPAQLVELALKRAIRTGEAGWRRLPAAGRAGRVRAGFRRRGGEPRGRRGPRRAAGAAHRPDHRQPQLLAGPPGPVGRCPGRRECAAGGVQELGSELFGWLDGLDREGAARTGGSLRSRCGA
jgi:cholesterol transport system auxiliary component